MRRRIPYAALQLRATAALRAAATLRADRLAERRWVYAS